MNAPQAPAAPAPRTRRSPGQPQAPQGPHRHRQRGRHRRPRLGGLRVPRRQPLRIDTDNAYVQGNVIQITPQVGGTVMAIMADDTDFVKAGAPLVQLDPADAKVALDQAEASLAGAVRQVRTLYANNGALAAQVSLRLADVTRAQTQVASAQSDVARANEDVNRRQSLTGNGAVSKEELNHAQTQLSNAKSALAAAKANVAASEAAVAAAREQLAQPGTDRQHQRRGASERAGRRAKVREAFWPCSAAALPAPVDGYVAKRTVQLGQRVPPARR
jgi:membrane fusion protein (multidrug efflux system)